MKNFIKGMLFVAAIIPLIDGFLGLFNQILEYVCSKIAVATYNLKKGLLDEDGEEDNETSHVVGFALPQIEAKPAEEE